MRNLFIVDEHHGIFYIRYRIPAFEVLPFTCPVGSYNILKARLFNDTYMNFLRIARNNYGAKLRGKVGYMIEVFTEKEKAEKLCLELNKRATKVLNEWEKYNEGPYRC